VTASVRPRDNPFRAARIDGLDFRDPEGRDVDAILESLAETRGRGAIIGPHGTGKSTLLDAIARRLVAGACTDLRRGVVGLGTPDAPLDVLRVQLHEDAPTLAADARRAVRNAGPGDAILIDGADLLPRHRWLALRWAARHAAVLLVTSHGRPLLPPIHRTRTTPALLHELVTELLRSHAAAPPPVQALERLYRSHDGNLRDALRALYDRFGAATEPPAHAKGR